jgi:hypothetical protein
VDAQVIPQWTVLDDWFAGFAAIFARAQLVGAGYG